MKGSYAGHRKCYFFHCSVIMAIVINKHFTGDESAPTTLMENLKKMFDQGPVTGIETSDDEDEYIEYIYKPRKYFLVSLCNVKESLQHFNCEYIQTYFIYHETFKFQLCKIDLRKVPQQVECLKCHMTYYCCTEHMQNDVEHRKLCRALQQVAQESCGELVCGLLPIHFLFKRPFINWLLRKHQYD